MDFCTGSILAEEGWARSVGSPSRKASPFPDTGKSQARENQRERERERTCGGGGGEEGGTPRAKHSRLGGKCRVQGQGSRGVPSRKEQGCELSVRQETGLAPSVPALMS